jgi:xylan 1,4-beta-xylosidase
MIPISEQAYAKQRPEVELKKQDDSRLIRNPILSGFHPDPSILRVGEDFFIANSTFEWFPGVQISASRDLVNWSVRTHCLTRRSQLDLRGTPRSGGVWAPCLTHDGRQFWLAFTHVKHWSFGFDDCHNFLVTAPTIDGPWSEPIYLNSSGFDPSLFVDRDGRKWLLNMLWDHRPGRDPFAGIVLQEYDERRMELIGAPKLIFRGTNLGRTEGPHLYLKGDFYYLVVAEGGTGLEHAVTMARSEQIDGPYETDPAGPMLTSKDAPELALQKAGHGSLVCTQNGEWYIAHLCARPVQPSMRCVLGRETALQRIEWNGVGWPRLATGGSHPEVDVPAPRLETQQPPTIVERDDFNDLKLGNQYQTLRIPSDEQWLSLCERRGYLRLRAMESPQSLHCQSIVARRFQSFSCRFETCLEFFPQNFQQMAGLMCLYDDQNFYYALIGIDQEFGRHVCVLESSSSILTTGPRIDIPSSARRVYLRADYHFDKLNFYYSLDGDTWTTLASRLDATILSDEHATGGLGFTGAFGAICAHDMSGRRIIADFDYFEYRELEETRTQSHAKTS